MKKAIKILMSDMRCDFSAIDALLVYWFKNDLGMTNRYFVSCTTCRRGHGREFLLDGRGGGLAALLTGPPLLAHLSKTACVVLEIKAFINAVVSSRSFDVYFGHKISNLIMSVTRLLRTFFLLQCNNAFQEMGTYSS